MSNLDSRVAVLEGGQRRVEARLKGIEDTQKAILETLLLISGGKTALIGLAKIVGACLAALAAIAATVKVLFPKLFGG